MKVVDLKISSLYLSVIDVPMLLVDSTQINGTFYVKYKFLCGKEIIEFEWSMFDTLTLKEI